MHWLYSGVQEHACLPPPGCTGPGKRLRQAEQSIIQAPPALIEQEWQRSGPRGRQLQRAALNQSPDPIGFCLAPLGVGCAGSEIALGCCS